MRYKVVNVYTDECLLETDDSKEAINKLKKFELRDYNKHLKYEQRCIENFEDPTVDERPAPYYCVFYIEDSKTNKSYDITDYYLLEREGRL